MTISRSAMVGILLFYSPIVIRIVLGPFPHGLVVGVYYLHRLIFSFMMALLTFKSLLAAAFIVDFGRMSGGIGGEVHGH